MFKSISPRGKLFIIIVIVLVVLAVLNTTTNLFNLKEKQNDTPTTGNVENVQKSTASTASVTTIETLKTLPQESPLESKYKKAYESFHAQKYSEAITLADEIIAVDPQFSKAYNIKGIALAYNKQPTKGLENINKALTLSPNDGYARFNKALYYELNGQYENALTWYDNALQVENYIWSYYGKASIYGRRGDVANTVKFLKIAIDMNAGIKGLAKEEADFNPVKSSKAFQDLTN